MNSYSGSTPDAPNLPYRIWHNKKYSHTACAATALDALMEENERLGSKACAITVTVSAAKSQSD